MSVSDIDLIHAWKQVLALSQLEPGQIVTVLTGADTHPQTLRCAIAASSEMGARVRPSRRPLHKSQGGGIKAQSNRQGNIDREVDPQNL